MRTRRGWLGVVRYVWLFGHLEVPVALIGHLDARRRRERAICPVADDGERDHRDTPRDDPRPSAGCALRKTPVLTVSLAFRHTSSVELAEACGSRTHLRLV